MQDNSGTSLREMLEQLPTSQLDEMLQAELKKPAPDAHAVRLILSILEEREAEEPAEMDAQTEIAWQQYQKRLEENRPQPKPAKHLHWRWLVTTAAVFVLVVTCVIPMQVDAETFREMLTRWKQDILEFFDPNANMVKKEHVFETDNEGLQQIYDAVLELGVEEPLIPMWFAEYELSTCEVTKTSSVNSVMATLTDKNLEAIFLVEFYAEDTFHGYFGEETDSQKYEKNGAKYEIAHNNSRWVAVWKKDKVEYFITLDCQEDTLRRILASIYVMEE